MRNFFLLSIVCAMLSACTFFAQEQEVAEEIEESAPSPEMLFEDAKQMLLDGNDVQAAALFDDVEREYPFSAYAPRSQIMAAFAYYRAESYDDAILSLRRYLDLYPGHDSADYAYYLIAVCFYEQISDVGRDQGMTREAKDALTDVVRRFPQTDYARDAQLKLDLTNDHLAGKEMDIGRYYANRKQYLAAIKRFRTVIQAYQTTSHVPEALHRLVELYHILGVQEQAVRYAAILGHNFPESRWYQRAYALVGKPTQTTQ